MKRFAFLIIGLIVVVLLVFLLIGYLVNPADDTTDGDKRADAAVVLHP